MPPADPIGAAAPVAPRAPRRTLRRIVVAVMSVLLVAVLVAAGVVTWSVVRPMPQTSGDLDVPGLLGPVDVLRDARGVPQIYADSPHDLFMAQGYVHAQDRFYEMDVRRHITAGRLAELFGASQVPTDTLIRTMGWRKVAEQEAALVPPQVRSDLQAYADGVNAYLAGRPAAATGVEYAVLGIVAGEYRPEPWTIVDSISWLKAMAWDLRGNMQSEVQRSLLGSGMSDATVDQLNPAYDFSRDVTVLGGSPGQAVRSPASAPAATGPPVPIGTGRGVPGQGLGPGLDSGLDTVLDSVLGSGGSWVGSNAFVVAGSRTTTGMPLLANDPHLRPSQPGIWYQVGLHCRVVGPGCPYDVAGFGFSGMPGVVIGHNADIAWGLTNIGADVTDLVLEKIDGGTYEYEGRQLPVTTRTETIKVAGGDPVTVTVRSTQNGPVISDAAPGFGVGDAGRVPGIPPRPGGYAVSLRWTALTPHDSISAVFLLDTATDWTSFRAAAARFAVPAQNMLYADRKGHIGYQMPGAIPIRYGGADGRYPAAGWSKVGSWIGEIPFDELPSQLDPPSGYIVSANNAVVGPDYPHFITADWGEGNRADRITQLVTTAGKLDPAAMSAIQSDTHNPIADALVPRLLAVQPGAAALPAQALLRGWDGMQPVDSAAAAYFNVVWRHLLMLTYSDDLAATATGYWVDQGPVAYRITEKLLDHPDDPLWANRTDPRHLRTRDDVLRAAMDDAAADLARQLGPDPSTWRWGALHTITLSNQTLGTGGPAPVQWALNQRPIQVPGSTDSVNAMNWNANDDYQVVWAPSMRMVVDLADLDASTWVNQTGVSGHAFADHYADQTVAWATGRTFDWPFSAAAVQAATVDRLRLRPAQP